jgi:hypothetical protein
MLFVATRRCSDMPLEGRALRAVAVAFLLRHSVLAEVDIGRRPDLRTMAKPRFSERETNQRRYPPLSANCSKLSA